MKRSVDAPLPIQHSCRLDWTLSNPLWSSWHGRSPPLLRRVLVEHCPPRPKARQQLLNTAVLPHEASPPLAEFYSARWLQHRGRPQVCRSLAQAMTSLSGDPPYRHAGARYVVNFFRSWSSEAIHSSTSARLPSSKALWTGCQSSRKRSRHPSRRLTRCNACPHNSVDTRVSRVVMLDALSRGHC